MSGKLQIGIGAAVNLALELLIQAQRVSTLIASAQARGDSTLNQEELDAILIDRRKAFANLDAAIAESEAEQPKE